MAGHVRMDHPERDDAHWLKTIVASKENGDVAIRTEPIGDVWDDIRPPGFARKAALEPPGARDPKPAASRRAADPAQEGGELRGGGIGLKLRVSRFDPLSEPHARWQEFDVPDVEGESVLGVLQRIRELFDSTLAFRYGCRFKGCGLCTLEIDGRALPACMIRAKEGMEVGPLGSFPVLRDLVVDRRPLTEFFARHKLHLVLPADGELPATFEVPPAYDDLAKCTECLACLATCPSFDVGNLGNPDDPENRASGVRSPS